MAGASCCREGGPDSRWGVENRLHWVLNTVMNEDQTRNRYCNSHMALNLIQRDRSQVSIRSKFNLAGWKGRISRQTPH
jgi:predicted transposase YbfD/YdcC